MWLFQTFQMLLERMDQIMIVEGCGGCDTQKNVSNASLTM